MTATAPAPIAPLEIQPPLGQILMGRGEIGENDLNKGLSFKISMGNVLTLSPPLIISKAQIDLSLSIINESLREAENIFGLTD